MTVTTLRSEPQGHYRATHVARAEVAKIASLRSTAITLGLTNARLEGMNSTVRLISHRARGFRRLESLLSMLTLVCGRIPVQLPT